jgi:hypothetical protein
MSMPEPTRLDTSRAPGPREGRERVSSPTARNQAGLLTRQDLGRPP